MDPLDNAGGHQWRVYDEHHRACDRCGLRVFWGKGNYRGWVMMDWRGVPSPPLLGSRGGSGFGDCKPVPYGVPVYIEYTGDPDVHPGCERIMHRAPGSSSSNALLDLGSLRPVCGWRCEWWELGPARDWPGWNWCADCFPEKHTSLRFTPPPAPALPRLFDPKRFPLRKVVTVELTTAGRRGFVARELVLECGHTANATQRTAGLTRTRCLVCSPSELVK